MDVHDNGTELMIYIDDCSAAYAGKLNATTGMAKIWNDLDGTEYTVYFKSYEQAKQLLAEAYNLEV